MFLDRPNRFLVTAKLRTGRTVSAYLPNTGRLAHLTVPGRELILRRDGQPPRKTEFTVTRAWDGTWVALEASRAPALLVDWLKEGNPLPGFGRVEGFDSEVSLGKHRIDLRLLLRTGPLWVEVKSGGRSDGQDALLSATPSDRGAAHIAALAELTAQGTQAAIAFVVQRGDVIRMRIGGDAEPGWIGAVERAHRFGLPIMAFGCDVTESDVAVARVLPLIWG